jgi:glutathione synthase/RimK-type ligase-like ATP-grasp enzyme
MATRILLTGGRAPATLDLARLLRKGGHEVYLAESLRFPITRFSKSIRHYIQVPQARFFPREYGNALTKIVREEHIDVFIPTCEETYYVAKVKDKLDCFVWADSHETFDLLHNKWTFINYAQKIGLAVPSTTLATSRERLMQILNSEGKVVLKPAYSRFASETIIWNRGDVVPETARPTTNQPWVVQQFIDGEHWCTYSLAKNGKLLAYSAYPSQERWGIGSSTVFEHVENTSARDWVEKFVSELHFTGQISFDFIKADDGTLYPIECNPRLTSGIHLFRDTPEFSKAFVAETHALIVPRSKEIFSIKLALVIRLLSLVFAFASTKEISRTLNLLFRSRDVLYARGDAWPVLGQLLCLIELFLQSARFRVQPTAITTYDSGYNGIDESIEPRI